MKKYSRDEDEDNKKKISLSELIKSIKGVKFLVFGLICGVFLIVAGSFSSEKNEDIPSDDKSSDSTGIIEFMNEYTDAFEQEIRAMIEHIDGVSNVRVMITLECMTEYVYAQNSSGSGESRTYATVLNSSRDENMVLIKEVAPKIRGVGVVCGGGSNPHIQAEIIDLCCSVFDINTNRVSVAEGK